MKGTYRGLKKEGEYLLFIVDIYFEFIFCRSLFKKYLFFVESILRNEWL
jgi:hypothetical protein